jgi:superfamily I DNA and/or RNA helicase
MLFDMEFDAVVVDESSMASLPYLAVMASRCASNLVIAGDPMQLPPIAVTSNPDAAGVLEQDIFGFASRAEQVSELFDWHDFNPLQTTFFDIQYRLKQDLADIISEVFYEGRLRTGSSEIAVNISPAKSYEVIDTSFFEPVITKKSQDFGFSPINEMHQKVLVDLVYQLVTKDLIPPGQVGVIVPFRSAVWDLRRAMRRKGLSDIEVGTIHTFQGREKRIIVFDTVMSGLVERGQTRHFSVRPFDETKNGLSVPRLLNVAFSRARERLIILADMNHINKVYTGKFLGRLLARLQR